MMIIRVSQTLWRPIDPMGEVDVVSGIDAASSVSGLAFGGGSAV